MKRYIVRPGDSLTSLAHRFDFSAQEVWGHGDNQALASKRSHGDILMPGDVLCIPDSAESPKDRVVPGGHNQYSKGPCEVTVSLRFLEHGTPIAGAACHVVELPDRKGTTDTEGCVTLRVPIAMQQFTLAFPDTGRRYAVRVGRLDPLSEISGLASRLRHLGYLEQGQNAHDPATLSFVLHVFQFLNDLPQTGAADADTLEAILKLHGS